MQFLDPVISSEGFSAEPQLQANLVMQLASIQSDKYPKYLQSLVTSLEAKPSFHDLSRTARDLLGSRKLGVQRLKIGWITADSHYHPVARFLYGMLAPQKNKFNHQHFLISLENHKEESYNELFSSILGGNLIDLAGLSGVDKLQMIRSQNYDVVVDLSGWTGGGFVSGLHARLAPVQVNYLGYFASSGLPTMDYWLGDSHLFPPGHSEWATESLWRLSRPFLAWNPLSPLPEADVVVSTAPSGPIRFGSFNHNRKLSDATLRLWGQLLADVPGSCLVLKASAQTDSDTQRLLRRRMVRHGLDPDRVQWLSLTKGLLNTCSNIRKLI